MSRHVILGKGPIGRTLADQLARAGHDVTVLSRSGAPAPTSGAIRHTALDVADADALAAATEGAEALYNCLNPAYHRWVTDWPPLAHAALHAAEASGAVLVTVGNLYAYGPGTHPMREDSPLASVEAKGVVRATMWREAQAAHDAGLLRATEVRGSDYLGPGSGMNAHAGDRMLAPLLAGRRLRPIGSADQPHSWTYLPDFARALAAAATTPAAWASTSGCTPLRTSAARCKTPKRCCSSITARPSRRKETLPWMMACVPTTSCSSPDSSPWRTSLACPAEAVRSPIR